MKKPDQFYIRACFPMFIIFCIVLIMGYSKHKFPLFLEIITLIFLVCVAPTILRSAKIWIKSIHISFKWYDDNDLYLKK
jgi:hypothetical protein